MTDGTPEYACSHIFNETRPMLLVSRVGGDWQFVCGSQHPSDDRPYIVGLNHLLERDPPIREVIKDLPTDWQAGRRSVGDAWIRTAVAPNWQQ